jgi:hypothetical protein
MNTHSYEVNEQPSLNNSIEVSNLITSQTNKKGYKMSKSKLLKEAIADAKAVRETAIANAKIALEEAFTPRLQSILSRKIQAEAEDMEDEIEVNEEYGADDVSATDSSEIGAGEGSTESGTDGANPTGIATDAHTELGDTDTETAEPGKEDDHTEVVDTLTEEEEETNFDSMEAPVEEDEDELDLEAIIRELEGEVEDDTYAEGEEEMEAPEMEVPTEEPAMEGEEEMEVPAPAMDAEAEVSEEEMEFDDEIDLDEILREMGYGEEEEEVATTEGEEEMEVPAMDAVAEKEAELEEAYSTIKSLRKTINEVNLLNAKLLYTNKLFRGYNLTNEQKIKVVENLDRTSNVREVKLVYATLAESMKFTGTEKKVSAAKKNITEGLASKVVASTAPKKEIISESVNAMADRFRKLAGII